MGAQWHALDALKVRVPPGRIAQAKPERTVDADMCEPHESDLNEDVVLNGNSYYGESDRQNGGMRRVVRHHEKPASK
jgi:hypothetical protein